MADAARQLEILRPWCLVALVVLLPVMYYGRHSLVDSARWQRNTSLAVRVLLVVVLVAALCGLKVTTRSAEQLVVFAVDHSRSVTASSGKAAEFLDEAMRHRGESAVVFLPFAGSPGAAAGELTRPSPAEPDATGLAAAIAAARAAVGSRYVPRVVLLSDGNQTAGDSLAAAKAAGAPVSTVPLPGRPQSEVYVSAVETKAEVRQGEPFWVDVVVQSTGEGDGTVELLRGPQTLGRQRVRLSAGTNRVHFRPSVTGQPAVTLTARIDGFADTIPANNRASAVVFTRPRPKVLLVAGRGESAEALQRALQEAEIVVRHAAPREMPEQAAELQAYDLLILANVPAALISAGRVEAVREYVRDFGGGLIVVGGDSAFTPGGYQDTALEAMLPVRSHVRKDKPKPSLAMVLVIDQSLSMKGKSIELAKQATRQAVEKLGPEDQVGVIAFEDESRWVSRLGPCADKRPVLRQIDTITAGAGGGTDVYRAMDKAYLALHQAFADLKHMIVLSDGLTQPGDFETLARDVAASGITVSTVAVGADSAPRLLADVARHGNGHYYYCDDPADVPRIFELETISAGKLGITEAPFFPEVVYHAAFLADLDLDGAPALLGYAETRPKPSGRLLLAAPGGDPLLAWWRYGRGVCAVFTSDVRGRWAAAWLRWSQFGPFWVRLARHAMRKDASQDGSLRVERQNDRALVTLEAVDRQDEYLNGAQAVLKVVEPRQRSRRVPMPQVAPGRYAAEFAAPVPGAYLLETTLRHGGRLVGVRRCGLVVGYADELRVRPTDGPLLRSIVRATGGRYDPKPAEVFAPSQQAVRRTSHLWPHLLAAALLIFMIDLVLKRMRP